MTNRDPESSPRHSSPVTRHGPVRVAAAIICEGGRYLVTKRKQGAHLGGLWEFPGGKQEPGEALDRCLARELREELGIEIGEPIPRQVIRHAYRDRTIELHFFQCCINKGEPHPLGCDEIRWVTARQLARLAFPEADKRIVEALAQHGPSISLASPRECEPPSRSLAPLGGEGGVRGGVGRARRLRRNQTDAERKLWALLRARQIEGWKFRRQHPIGRYVVDFFCPERMLVVELDGSQHMIQEDADLRRTEWLGAKGYRVIRFWDHEVLTAADAVMDRILEVMTSPSPQPSPSKRARGRTGTPR